MKHICSVATVQFAPVYDEIAQNFQQIESLVKDLDDDIVVLPELCTTGYSFLNTKEVEGLALTAEEFADFLGDYSVKNNNVIIAGFAEKDEDRFYNSTIALMPDKSYIVYRKTHLFYKEKICFSYGDTGFFVFNHPNLNCRIGMMICYDWRFPESARTLALKGADIITCSANLVTPYWETGLKSRALENNVFVAVSNRYGSESRQLPDGTMQTLTFTGKSVIYDNHGITLQQAAINSDAIIRATIDTNISRNKSFDELDDIFNDRRPTFYMNE